METLIELDNVSFFYPGNGDSATSKEEAALANVNLSIRSGDFVILIGPSGCGKSTLLQIMAGVIPEYTGGRIRGRVLVESTDILRTDDNLMGRVGLVLQNPESQLTNLFVEDEVMFPLENMCLPRQEILQRTEEVIRYARLGEIRGNFVYQLSGGQTQRVAIASGLAMRPKVLLMDGPTTNLDPEGADEVLHLISRMRNTGETEAVVIAANKIDAFLKLATRIVVMDRGRVVADGPPDLILERLDFLEDLGVFIPGLGKITGQLQRDLGTSLQLICTVEEAGNKLSPLCLKKPAINHRGEPSAQKEEVINVQGVSFGYTEKDVLRNLSLTVPREEFLAVVGQNGSGKTTLMKLIAGLRKPRKGDILVGKVNTKKESPLGRVGYVFQNPEHQFVATTVREELEQGLEQLGIPPNEIERKTMEMLKMFRLARLRNEPPYTLSMGEKRLLSVATVLILEPEIVILDEPTTGLDRKSTRMMMSILDRFVRKQGITVIQVSHDMEQVAEFATRVVVLESGQIIHDSSPRELFAREDILQTCKLGAPPAARLSKLLWPEAESLPITTKEFLGR